jgi:hypothetical protein
MNPSDFFVFYEPFLDEVHQTGYCQNRKNSIPEQRKNHVYGKPPAFQNRNQRFTDLIRESGGEKHQNCGYGRGNRPEYGTGFPVCDGQE